jgi:hypothetical protein
MPTPGRGGARSAAGGFLRFAFSICRDTREFQLVAPCGTPRVALSECLRGNVTAPSHQQVNTSLLFCRHWEEPRQPRSVGLVAKSCLWRGTPLQSALR